MHRLISLLLLIAPLTLIQSCRFSDSTPPPGEGEVVVIGSRGREPGQFFRPRAVTVDATGDLFVVDRSGWVQRLSADGAPEERWRLPAWDNGTPTGIQLDDEGNVWLADTHCGRILVYSRDGELLRMFGEAGDAPGQMIFPTDVALDGRGFVYVTEYGVRVRILKFTVAGEFVEEWSPIDEETGEQLLMRPMAVVWDEANNNLLVADSCHHRLIRFSTAGEVLQIIGHEGTEPGEFRYPYDVALTPNGEILVCEYGNARVQRLASDGSPLAVWGSEGRRPGELWCPWGVTMRSDGATVVADTENHRLQVITL